MVHGSAGADVGGPKLSELMPTTCAVLAMISPRSSDFAFKKMKPPYEAREISPEYILNTSICSALKSSCRHCGSWYAKTQ